MPLCLGDELLNPAPPSLRTRSKFPMKETLTELEKKFQPPDVVPSPEYLPDYVTVEESDDKYYMDFLKSLQEAGR